MSIVKEDIRKRLKALNGVVLIPTYNNAGTLLKVLSAVHEYSDDILVVNDGSTDTTKEILSSLNYIKLVSYAKNRGKGYALKVGIREATQLGYKYALTMDSDGQHYASDIATFVEAAEKSSETLFIGARNLQAENMPQKNTFANKFSNFWFKVETGIHLTDTQSGFRWYPLEKLSNLHFISSRYEFEVEIIVRAAWKGISVKNIPIKVYYPPQGERVSHFKPAKDFTRISILNTFLVLYAILFYYPWRFLRSLTWDNIKKFIHNNITHSPESNLRLSLSIGLGICCGILPIWGWQMWLAIFIAHICKLNKVIAFVFSNISIPPMIPFILFGSYYIGCKLLGNPVSLLFSQITKESVMLNLGQYILGSVVLGIGMGVACWLVSWGIFSIFRKR